MTDAELIARLRDADLYNAQHYERDPLHKQSADRIEALTAKLATCEKYRDAYAECDRIGTQAVRDLEAKLAKAVEALEGMINYATWREKNESVFWDVTGPARATLAEIKGESHE
jgi:hypothetical protein